MKALVKTGRGPGNLELCDVPEPTPQPGWVVLAVRYGGVCGTDLHIERDEHPYYPPVVLGHEFAGSVAALGPDVTGWAVGDRVVCEPHALHCGLCPMCRRGLVRLCESKRAPGWGINGAFAPYVAVPTGLLHRIPDEVSDERAAVCEPAAIASRAVNRVGIAPGERVAVLGPGPIGMISALVATARGADQVVLFGRTSSAARLRLAQDLGLECSDTPEEATEFDVVLDTTGSSAAIASGIAMLRRAGRLATVGISTEPTPTFPWNEAIFKSVDVAFSFSSSYEDWRGALSLMRRGALPTERLTTVFDLADWAQAFAAIGERRVTKALLDPR
jgi:L-iditol 2-dehydrogenase